MKRYLPHLAFLAGLAAGAAAFLLVGRHEIAFVCFVVVWYAIAYGLPKIAAHPEHRRSWLTHVVLLPVVWVAATVLVWVWLDSLVGAVVLGGIAAVALQALATAVVLRTVRADQLHDLRRRLGIE